MAGRPKGSRSSDYDVKRRDLVSRLRESCFAEPTERLSMRQLAKNVGVTVPTLLNYFDDRHGVVRAILKRCWQDAADRLEHSIDPTQSFEDRVCSGLSQLHLGMSQFGLDRLFIWGMTEGMTSKILGHAYLEYFLEPTLQNAEGWLGFYRDQGDIRADVDLRHAAISYYSPYLVAVMHQKFLAGSSFRELDFSHFLNQHAKLFALSLRP